MPFRHGLRCRMKIFDFHPAVFPSVRPASLQACPRRDRATSPFTWGGWDETFTRRGDLLIARAANHVTRPAGARRAPLRGIHREHMAWFHSFPT